MDHVEMVAWVDAEHSKEYALSQVRPDAVVYHTERANMLASIHNELERLRHVEVEHQGCTENAVALERERDDAHEAWNDHAKKLKRERDEAQADVSRLQQRLKVVQQVVQLPPGEGWASKAETRQRIGATLDTVGAGDLDDDVLDAVACMIEAAERERDAYVKAGRALREWMHAQRLGPSWSDPWREAIDKLDTLWPLQSDPRKEQR
ncbi:MAG: hypothetical protein RL885_24955 [Planctomycetota bacterium]